MIYHVKGNLLESEAQALVNTVNTVGVMGKGIALQFKEAYPDNFRAYYNACKKKELHIGQVLVVEDSNLINGHKIIINFPTKTHWRYPSEYSYIEKGLQSLRKEIEARHIKSIAIPPLGSHNGGLDWFRVKQMVETVLCDLDCDIYLYEPSAIIIEKMKSERIKLTPARAMLLMLLADLIKNGEFASVFAAEKLVYFMQRMGAENIFKIEFKRYYYGPYSGGKVAHVLYALNGSYVKGMGGMEVHPFDYIWLLDDTEQEASRFINDSRNAEKLLEICEKTKTLLRDYYSNYSLELLATVDYLLDKTPSLQNWRNDDEDNVIDILETEIHQWSKRKEQIFKRKFLYEAYRYLKKQSVMA